MFYDFKFTKRTVELLKNWSADADKRIEYLTNMKLYEASLRH